MVSWKDNKNWIDKVLNEDDVRIVDEERLILTTILVGKQTELGTSSAEIAYHTMSTRKTQILEEGDSS